MKLPGKWVFDARPTGNFARSEGMALEVRHIAHYYRAELLVEEPQPSVAKHTWYSGMWCHRATEEDAIAAVEQLAIAAEIVEPR